MAKTKKTESDRLHDPDVRNALIAGDVPHDELKEHQSTDKNGAPLNPKPKE